MACLFSTIVFHYSTVKSVGGADWWVAKQLLLEFNEFKIGFSVCKCKESNHIWTHTFCSDSMQGRHFAHHTQASTQTTKLICQGRTPAVCTKGLPLMVPRRVEALMVYLTESICGLVDKCAYVSVYCSWQSWFRNWHEERHCKATNISEPITYPNTVHFNN